MQSAEGQKLHIIAQSGQYVVGYRLLIHLHVLSSAGGSDPGESDPGAGTTRLATHNDPGGAGPVPRIHQSRLRIRDLTSDGHAHRPMTVQVLPEWRPQEGGSPHPSTAVLRMGRAG
ncbi:unnamed protein product [Boreogadus saida]